MVGILLLYEKKQINQRVKAIQKNTVNYAERIIKYEQRAKRPSTERPKINNISHIGENLGR